MSALIVGAIEEAVADLTPLVGRKAACEAVGVPRASHYRHHPAGKPRAASPDAEPSRESSPVAEVKRRPQLQPRALSEPERLRLLEILHSERFTDAAPATVYATLLDEGIYLGSESTMYRLLREHGETGDRRRHATHPPKVKPELVASGPNQV